MVNIKRYRIKHGFDKQILIDEYDFRPGGSWISKDVKYYNKFTIGFYKYRDIVLYIGIPDDIKEWNDIDYVLVVDNEVFYPLKEFYDLSFGSDEFRDDIVRRYNMMLDELEYLEEVHDDEPQ